MHMVVYRTDDGEAGYYQAEDLEHAVEFVEHLLNDEMISDSLIYRMEEVPIEIRSYYRVELGRPKPPAIEPIRVPPSETSVLGPPTWAMDERSGEAEIAAAGRRLGLFGTG